MSRHILQSSGTFTIFELPLSYKPVLNAHHCVPSLVKHHVQVEIVHYAHTHTLTRPFSYTRSLSQTQCHNERSCGNTVINPTLSTELMVLVLCFGISLLYGTVSEKSGITLLLLHIYPYYKHKYNSFDKFGILTLKEK